MTDSGSLLAKDFPNEQQNYSYSVLSTDKCRKYGR